MRAFILGDDPRLDRDHPEPSRRAGEALIRVRVAGVCDTDVQLAKGYMGFRGVAGHEFVGDVISSDTASLVGRRVVADINAGCGACADCARAGGDAGHHCASRTVLGIVGRSGAFADYLAVPDRCVVPIASSVPDDHAVFAEPLAAALHVLDEIEKTDELDRAGKPARAIVLGDGKLGQLIAAALVSAQIDTSMIGRHAAKLALASRAGARTFVEGDDLGSAAGADVVVEATGSEAGLARAIELVRPRGTIVLKTTVAAPFQIDLAPLVIHEIRLVGSRCGDMRRAATWLADQRVDPTPLIEARYSLDQAPLAFEHARRRGALKILIDAQER